MSFRWNLFSNYLATFVSAVAPILTLPIFLKYVPTAEWGFVGLVSTVISLFAILESGVGQGITREFAFYAAKSAEPVKVEECARLLFSYEIIYWVFSAVLCIIILILGPQISNHWLVLPVSLESLSQRILKYAAVLVFLHFSGLIYRAALIGSGHQIANSLISVGGAFIRYGLALILVRINRSVEMIVLPYVLAIAFETMLRYRHAWHSVVKMSPRISFWSSDLVKITAPKLLVLTSATLISSVASQLDKVVLSGIVSIEQFGYYTIATSVGLGILQIYSPLLTALLPRIVSAHQLKSENVKNIYLTTYVVITIINIFGIVLFYNYGISILTWWLVNENVVSQVYLPLFILLIGSAFSALYSVGYMMMIIKSEVRKILCINLMTIVVTATVLYSLAKNYGIGGAAVNWLIINLFSFILSLWYVVITLRKALPS